MGESKKVIIIGTSGHSRVAFDIFVSSPDYDCIGFLDSFKPLGEDVFGSKVIGNPEKINVVISNYPDANFFIAIGDNYIRFKLSKILLAQNPNLIFVNAIHPSSIISGSVKMGKGILIAAGVVVNPGTTLSDFSIINTNASVDHDNEIGSFASLGPNTATGGNVRIGEFSALCIQSCVKHGVKLGKNTVVGANSYVHQSFGDNKLVFGTPAIIRAQRELGDLYL